jgi:iron complex transport system substrate-binding protein
VGTLFGKEKEAVSFFNKIEKEYLDLKKLTADKDNKPKVLVGSPYKDSWWVPGADSYMANLIIDAGGNYLGKGNPTSESYIISFEHALTWGHEADVWINMGNMSSKKEILAREPRFESFKVFREGKVYNNIKGLSTNGGNDFWESGTVYPNLVLRDLIAIFYPELIDNDLVYYSEIK